MKDLLKTDVLVGGEKEYNEAFNKLADFVAQGDREKGTKELNDALKEMGVDENATPQEKYAKLHEFAKKYQEMMHDSTMEATDGKGYEAFKTEAEHAYNAAFGVKNDIARRVNEYNTSQQTGAMITGGVLKGLGALTVLIPGVGVVAASCITAAVSASVDVTDRLSSEEGLKEDEIANILKNAAIDGATMFGGAKLAKMLTNVNGFLKLGGQITGDVAIGAAAEKMQTGEITINGLVFQCVFSAAGNLVALKNMGKAKKTTSGVPAKAGSNG